METDKNISLTQLKRQIEAMKRKVAKKERKLKKLEKAAQSGWQNKDTREENVSIASNTVSQKQNLKEFEGKNSALNKKCDGVCHLQITDKDCESRSLVLKEVEDTDKYCTESEYDVKNNNKFEKGITNFSKEQAKPEDIRNVDSNYQNSNYYLKTVTSEKRSSPSPASSTNVADYANNSDDSSSVLRRSVRLAKRNKYLNRNVGSTPPNENEKNVEENLKIKKIFSFLVAEVKRMNVNDFVLSHQEFLVKSNNFKDPAKEFTDRAKETVPITPNGRISGTETEVSNNSAESHTKEIKCESQLEDKENASTNLSHCLKTENNERVEKIHHCQISESKNEVIVIRQITTCSFWIKDGSSWALNCTYCVEKNTRLLSSCLLCKNSVYLVVAEERNCGLELSVLRYIWENGNLSKLFSQSNIIERNIQESTIVLCEIEELKCAVMLSNNVSNIFILNVCENDECSLSSLHSGVGISLTSLLPIKKLPEMLLGCGTNYYHIWNYVSGKMIFKIKANNDTIVDKCLWAQAEKGFIFLIISTTTNVSLVVINPNTSKQAILKTYNGCTQDRLISAKDNRVILFDKNTISIYNIFTAKRMAFSTMKEVTTVAEIINDKVLLLGFENGCTHLYNLTKSNR
ncbi:uncharacterized protein [Centruroides vittatus]|uniref:uncharacterized protein n=1 Tax=Centruroides vittatus TaxID=120091 RepID=UPI00350FB8AC